MPILDCDYDPPRWLCNGHVQTMWPVLFRKIPEVAYRRERVKTADGDFFDMDMLCAAGEERGRRVVLLSHGLEGNTHRKYMRGMARALYGAGWDVAARNLRGCSGEPNRRPRMYHMGETDDLHAAVLFCLERNYHEVVLMGFSLGGNQTLKYLGEASERVPEQVRAAVAFSVPCDLSGAAPVMDRPACAVYMEYFMRTLRRKMAEKAERFPDFPSVCSLNRIRSFAAFDGRFTAPVHGFTSAQDYWKRNGSLAFLPQIRIPTLLVNAADDPFLSPSCYPREIARNHPHLHLEIPMHGGHVGFVIPHAALYWSETRALRFLREHCSQ